MKETRFINRFSEKNSHLGKRAILGPKIVNPYNSGSTGRTLHNEKGELVNESNNNCLYLTKICSGQMGHSGPENGSRIIITLDQF